MRSRRSRYSKLPRLDVQGRLASPIAGQVWTRASLKRPRQLAAFRRWRALTCGLALLELALLGWLAAGPVFQVRQVQVLGARHLQPAQVIAAAGLRRPGSIFAVDAGAARHQLAASPWVRTSAVRTELPDRVVVTVEEWSPVAIFKPGPGDGLYISDQAIALGPASSPEGLLEIVGPAQAPARPGHGVMGLPLLTALVNIQRAFPGLYGQEVARFQADCNGNLTLETRRGWKVFFGRVLTPEEFDGLRLKLGALKAIQGHEDFNSPDLEYVNLMDASLPAVKHRSAPPPAAPAPAPPAAPSRGVLVVPCR